MTNTAREFETIEDAVVSLILGGGEIDGVLERVVEFQRATIPALAEHWRRRGFLAYRGDPGEIPAVATDVFRHVRLVSNVGEPTVVFRTSGSTSGRRGESWRLSTRAYDASALAQFRRRVCGHLGEDEAISFVNLVFDPAVVPDSSLSHMVGVLSARWDRVAARYHLHEGGVDALGLVERLAEIRGPAVVVGTAFAFVGLLDAGLPGVRLPEGSRIIETGGFKGRSREISRAELVAALSEQFGVAARDVLSEYSMTELSSQLYTDDDDSDDGASWLVPPPWCLVTAVDPETLAVREAMEVGLLRFVDLANVDTPVAVQTSDLGRVDARGRVELLGRSPGATPRGCSLAAEEVLAIADRRRGRFT